MRREAALRQGLTARRDPLPSRQRKLKGGTTTFMLVMHVGAVFALLPRFWSLQGLIVLAVLYWITGWWPTAASMPPAGWNACWC